MNKFVIIGTGGLGRRHLQGLATASVSSDIIIYDPNTEAVNSAVDAFNEIKQEHAKLFVVDSLDKLPTKIDLMIVATNSRERFEVLSSALKNSSVGVLIMEKFLFPKLIEFEQANELIKKSGSLAFVNCPLRMWPLFQKIKARLSNSKQYSIDVCGNGWGLGCNSIHYLDLFSFITGDEEFALNFKGLDPKWIESKRDGYIEFTGTINGYDPKTNSSLRLTSFNAERTPILIRISSEKGQYMIRMAPEIDVMEILPESKWDPKFWKAENQFQSKLSSLLAESISNNSLIQLPSYEISAKLHTSLLVGFLNHLRDYSETITDTCYIT